MKDMWRAGDSRVVRGDTITGVKLGASSPTCGKNPRKNRADPWPAGAQGLIPNLSKTEPLRKERLRYLNFSEEHLLSGTLVGAKPRDSLMSDSARRGGHLPPSHPIPTFVAPSSTAHIFFGLEDWARIFPCPVWRGCVTSDQDCGLSISG